MRFIEGPNARFLDALFAGLVEPGTDEPGESSRCIDNNNYCDGEKGGAGGPHL